jgi:cysteinyl-tRNA synthetase
MEKAMATVANAASGKSTAEPTPSIRVYNTLTKVKEPFTTVQPGKVGMYLCGPTVYKEAHIGHMVGPVIFDTIKRYLAYSGYEVTWVVNITDVDDKLIAESHRRGISMFQVATEMTADYLANLQSLGVNQIDFLPRATDNIDEIIRFIEELIAKDVAYASNGDVYFDVMRDPQYGQLSNRSPDSQQGEGGETASRKRNPGDFALWKSAKPGEPYWDSPWGQGRPGWHIECSAMSRRILGKTFDIHGGGLDLVFPHHENELAQSRCCHGQPMVKYWLHNGLMKAASQAGKVGGKSDRDTAAAEPEQAEVSSKISRSKGGGGLAALIEKQTGERIRFFLLRSHYRSTIVFDDEGLAEAGTSLESFYRLFTRYQRLSGESFYDIPYCTKRSAFVAPTSTAATGADDLLKEAITRRSVFLEKMDDDFNTGGAVSDLFELARAINRFIDAVGLEDAAKRTDANLKIVRDSLAILRELASLLGVFTKPAKKSAGGDKDKVVDGLMKVMLAVRAEARKTKNFPMADMIRDGLSELKITVQDLKDGTTWQLAE